MNPAIRALQSVKNSPELLESVSRNLRGSRNAKLRKPKRDPRSWDDLPEDERMVWRRRAIVELTEHARNYVSPDGDPDPDGGEPMPALLAA